MLVRVLGTAAASSAQLSSPARVSNGFRSLELRIDIILFESDLSDGRRRDRAIDRTGWTG